MSFGVDEAQCTNSGLCVLQSLSESYLLAVATEIHNGFKLFLKFDCLLIYFPYVLSKRQNRGLVSSTKITAVDGINLGKTLVDLIIRKAV